MRRNITLTEERFLALMKAAYEDGFDDGQKSRSPDGPARTATEKEWEESVTNDQAHLAIAKARSGATP